MIPGWRKVDDSRWEREDGSAIVSNGRGRWNAVISSPGGGGYVLRKRGGHGLRGSGPLPIRSWTCMSDAIAAVSAEKPWP